MSDGPSISIETGPFMAALQKLGQDLSGPAADAALMSGAQVLVSEIKVKAPVKRGDYRRSIHAQKSGPGEVKIGTDKPQGKRLEYGFNQADKRGRRYHQPARPHFRPAIDTKGAAAVAEVGKALGAIVEKAGR
jgi:hypothetical protein